MTEAQVLRAERRQMVAERRRQRRIETALTILGIILAIAAFAIAGTMDYNDEMRDLAFWAERGVTIQRW